MSLFSSTLGLDASKAAGKAANKNAKVQGQYAKLFQGASEDYDLLHKLFGGDNALAGYTSALNTLNQSPQQQVDRQAAQNSEQAQRQSNQLAAFFRSQGFGDGLTAGASQAAFQNAATQTNRYAADAYSPEAAMRRILAFLQAQQGVEGNALNALQTFGQGAYANVQQPQSSPLASIASILPLFL